MNQGNDSMSSSWRAFIFREKPFDISHRFLEYGRGKYPTIIFIRFNCSKLRSLLLLRLPVPKLHNYSKDYQFDKEKDWKCHEVPLGTK